MKKIGKALLYVVIAVILIAVIAVVYITLALPNVGPAENITIQATMQRIAHGKYLTLHVSGCLDCHSPGDETRFGAPVDTMHYGAGGKKFDAAMGFPGSVTVPNITPFALKDWTDGELFRAITTGVKKDGSAIFPLMPWPYYAKMDREDIYDIIAYLRTLKPVNTSYPKSKLDFPLNIIVHTMPAKASLVTKPDPQDSIKYGAYLVQSAACKECHSQDNNGTPLPGLEFAGGKQFTNNGCVLRSANITPDKNTGIGNWTRADFIARFKAFNDPGKAAHLNKTDFQTIMPWWQYNGMTEGDLASIYKYLRTVKPVNNKVMIFQANSAPTSN